MPTIVHTRRHTLRLKSEAQNSLLNTITTTTTKNYKERGGNKKKRSAHQQHPKSVFASAKSILTCYRYLLFCYRRRFVLLFRFFAINFLWKVFTFWACVCVCVPFLMLCMLKLCLICTTAPHTYYKYIYIFSHWVGHLPDIFSLSLSLSLSLCVSMPQLVLRASRSFSILWWFVWMRVCVFVCGSTIYLRYDEFESDCEVHDIWLEFK